MSNSPEAPAPSDPFMSHPARLWFVTLGAGFLAGAAAWAAGESVMISETGSGSRGGGFRSHRWSTAPEMG